MIGIPKSKLSERNCDEQIMDRAWRLIVSYHYDLDVGNIA